ncbi:MAG: hypothetical protein R2781_00760 [Flavobacteriaceae bacterium]
MKYLITKMATDWPMPSRMSKILSNILFFIPKSRYHNKNWHLINNWLIEFTETNGELLPWREIALDDKNDIIFAGPSDQFYGYWLDTNMTFNDFEGEEIDKEEFERLWKISGVIKP